MILYDISNKNIGKLVVEMSECFIIPVWLVGVVSSIYSIISWYLVLNHENFINPTLDYFVNRSTTGGVCLMFGIVPVSMCAIVCGALYGIVLFGMILNSLPCIQFTVW